LGGRIPKGVLLVGPPGTAQDALARAIAGEAKPLLSPSPVRLCREFVVGFPAPAAARHVEQAKKEHSPCIVFIDEI